jgi:hypothetical protein
MKQSIFKLLSCSLILLFALSCKKEKKGLRVLDGFPPGKFDFVWVWNQNGVPDTITGEVSGPYPSSGGNYHFRRQLVSGEDEPDFILGGNGATFYTFYLEFSSIYDANITSYDITKDKLFLSFEKGNTVTGIFSLTRKQ